MEGFKMRKEIELKYNRKTRTWEQRQTNQPSKAFERLIGYSVILLIGFCGFSYYKKEEVKHFVKFEYNPTDIQTAVSEAIINGLRPEFFISLIKGESNFKADAISSTGNIGCGQLSKYALKVLGMTKEDALDCKKSIAGAARWLAYYGSQEIGEMDEYKLSSWYYCGINLYGKVIYDKHYKRTEVCGTSYSTNLQTASRGNTQQPKQFAKLNNQIKISSKPKTPHIIRVNH